MYFIFCIPRQKSRMPSVSKNKNILNCSHMPYELVTFFLSSSSSFHEKLCSSIHNPFALVQKSILMTSTYVEPDTLCMGECEKATCWIANAVRMSAAGIPPLQPLYIRARINCNMLWTSLLELTWPYLLHCIRLYLPGDAMLDTLFFYIITTTYVL